MGEACDAVRARQGNCVFVLNHHLLCSSILGYLALVDSQSSTDINFQWTAFGFLFAVSYLNIRFAIISEHKSRLFEAVRAILKQNIDLFIRFVIRFVMNKNESLVF